jgi:hypothetical protein
MSSENFCYKPLTEKAVFVPKYFWENFSSLSWQKYFAFDAAELPIGLILENEPVLQKLNQTFKIQKLGVLLLKKNTSYNWHKDTVRGVAINLLLSTSHNSHCIFTRDSSKTVSEIVELKYSPDTFYVFNNQCSHMVVNLDFDRYLFSVEFEKPKEYLTFFNVKHWADTN